MPNAEDETSAVTHPASSDPRCAFLGQLSASIAGINQPISAVVMNAEAALWLLLAQTADMEAVRQLLTCIVRDGMRAGDIVNCTRALTDRKRADERMRAREISLCVTET